MHRSPAISDGTFRESGGDRSRSRSGHHHHHHHRSRRLANRAGIAFALAACLLAVLRDAGLPILTKPAHIAEFPARAREWFAADERAGDLYALAYPAEAQRTAGQERRYTPVYLEG